MSELRLYDIDTDQIRPATQADIEQLLAVKLAYFEVRRKLRDDRVAGPVLAKIHEDLQARIRKTQERAA